MYKLTVDFPNLAKGAEVQIAGLGTYENGSESVVTNEEHESFRRYHGRIETTRHPKTQVDSNKFVPGPTLLEASKNMHGITVKTAGAPQSDNNKKEGDDS